MRGEARGPIFRHSIKNNSAAERILWVLGLLSRRLSRTDRELSQIRPVYRTSRATRKVRRSAEGKPSSWCAEAEGEIPRLSWSGTRTASKSGWPTGPPGEYRKTCTLSQPTPATIRRGTNAKPATSCPNRPWKRKLTWACYVINPSYRRNVRIIADSLQFRQHMSPYRGQPKPESAIRFPWLAQPQTRIRPLKLNGWWPADRSGTPPPELLSLQKEAGLQLRISRPLLNPTGEVWLWFVTDSTCN